MVVGVLFSGTCVLSSKEIIFVFNAIAICPSALASIEGDVPCFFRGVGMDEIRCVECRLLI